MKYVLVVVCLLGMAPVALAARVAVTPEMRASLTEKLTAQCLAQEGEFTRKGYTRTQADAICKCAMQQTGALLNSRTVEYIFQNGVMPDDMKRKAASATEGCIRTITHPRKP